MTAQRRRNITRMRPNSSRSNRTRLSDSSKVTNYGDILAQTRENHGLSLKDVADELHVREDILIALENSDFDSIPPQGYSRNMIKSYSRLLGLNANKMTDMFLDAEYSYRIGEKRASIQEIRNQNKQRMPDVGTNAARLKTPREQIEEQNRNKTESNNYNRSDRTQSYASPFGNRTTHTMHQRYKNTPRARQEYGAEEDLHRGGSALNRSRQDNSDLFSNVNHNSAKERLRSRQKANRISTTSGYAQNNLRNHNRYAKNDPNYLPNKQRHHLGRQDINKPQYEDIQTNTGYSSKKGKRLNFMQLDNSDKVAASQQRIKLPFIIAIVVFLVIILILFLFLMGKHQENSKTDVSNIQVTGLTDPDKNSNNNNNNQSNLIEPTSVDFTFKVADGKSAYIEIYENGSSTATLAQTCTGGETKTYKVTSTLKFVTTSPNNVSITVNGEAVSATDDDGNGVYTYELDFSKYLNEWKTKNKVGTSSSTNNSNSSATNNSSSSSSSNNNSGSSASSNNSSSSSSR